MTNVHSLDALGPSCPHHRVAHRANQDVRTEPGCLLHSVHHDAEDPHRLVFLEHWADTSALRAHFEVPASGAFVTELAGFAQEPPEMQIYEAHTTSV